MKYSLFRSIFCQLNSINLLPIQYYSDNIKSTNELTWQSQTGLSQPSHPSKQLISQGQSEMIWQKIYFIQVSIPDVIYRWGMRCFLLRIRLYKRYHRLDSSKCTRLDWFHNVPYRPNSNPVPWNQFQPALKLALQYGPYYMAHALNSKKIQTYKHSVNGS